MNRIIANGLACPVVLVLSFTASAEPHGALKTADVVVTASRISQPRENVLADVTVIEQDDIERAGQSSLVELLQRQPGVETVASGGAGKATSVFLRGTNADHVVVMVDGLRVNSATLGTTSFESLPLAQIERIEILRGPASSLYGADAIGGVIQIFTKRGEGAAKFNSFAGIGSYNTRRADAGVSGSLNGTHYALNLSSQQEQGLSARKANTGADADKDPYRNHTLSAALSHDFDADNALELQLFASSGHNDYDSTSTNPNNQYTTAYADTLLRSYGVTSHNRVLPWWNSTVRLGVGEDSAKNFTRTVGNVATFSQYHTEQFQGSWQNDLTLPLGTLTLAYDRLEQDVIGTTNYTVKSRHNNGWLASYLAELGAHSVQASVRRDDNAQYGSHTTGGVSYGYRITPQWRASASFGTAFKAPTFNQLYFPNFGDPNLKPETSRNSEAALRYQSGHASAGLTLFDNEINNLIAFSGSAGPGCAFAGFCPENVGKAQIRGATLDGKWYFGHWVAGGNLTVQSPRDDATGKLLLRRGQRHGTFNLAYQADQWRVGAEVQAASERYNDAANTKRMEGYALVNLTASYAVTPAWQVEGRVNNLFDKNYILAYTGNAAAADAFETPGASVFVGLRWQPE